MTNSKKHLIPVFILLLSLSCSKPGPTNQDIKSAITTQVQSNLAGNQKIVSVSIKDTEEKTGHADFEGPDSQNEFWTVESEIAIKTTVVQKKFPLFKKKYKSHTSIRKEKFKIWKNSKNVWVANRDQ